MKKKKTIIIIAVIFLVLGLFSLCSNDEETENNNTENESVVEENKLFEDDDIVNGFLNDYQEISNTEFKEISSSRKYKCFALVSGYEFEVGHYHNIETDENTLGIRIEQTNETADAGVPAMREVYYYTVKTLDNSLSDEDIYKIFDGRMNDEDEYKGEQQIGKIKLTITPDMELSGGHSRGHIDISKTLDE